MHFPRLGGGTAPSGQQGGGSSASTASGASSKAKEDGDIGDGKFDPDNLEKGANALKEIDKSLNSGWGFELAASQEKTKQLEGQLNIEKERSQRALLEEQIAQVQSDEARKNISCTADQERSTAQHKAEVENRLQQGKLELQEEQLKYQLHREHEQFLQHEQVRMNNELELEEARRETIRLKAQHDMGAMVDSAKAEALLRAQQERENIEVRLREMRAKKSEERKTRLDAIEEVFSGLGSGCSALYEDRGKAVTLVAGLTALALGVYSARAGVRVASGVLERHLGRPPLVRETSRWTWRPQLKWLPWATNEAPNIFERIVLEETLAERLKWTTNALLNAQQNGTPFRHLMLHGSPGTGKTLFARTLARQSGLDYAIMSGGDLGPLGNEGPNELHKLFAWANRSKRGLVLFIDEADAFLRRGRQSQSGGMGEDARNALSVFLHHTGTENPRLAVIVATNLPGVLDRAVLDRLDESFEFPMPAYEQRLQMLQMFVDQYVRRPTKRGWLIEVDPAIDEAFLQDVATRTDGLSGRQIAKLVLAFQSAVFGSGTQRLTLGLAETVLRWRLDNPDS